MIKKVLITGGAGLIGSSAAEYYARKGTDVIVFDNLMRSNIFGYRKKSVEYNWRYLAKYPNIKRIKGDVRNKRDLLEVITKKVDMVIHAAGQPGVPSSVRNPELDFSINAQGTLNVLECLRKVSPQATFIYCSTNKVYGENVDKTPLRELKTRYIYKNIEGISEKTAVDKCGHTPYGVSKYVGDIYTQEYAYLYGMKTAVFRMSCTYGPRQFGFEDQGWVAHFIISTLTNRPITIYGNGKQVRDLLYVEDLIRAFNLFVKTKTKHAVYNIGGGHGNTLSLLEFLDILRKKLDKEPKVKFARWRPSDQKVYISDISKIENELGWSPNVSAKDGIERLISWIKENKNLFK